ncbi:MAG: pyrophosphatase, partial [Defluviitaleaceae bacterium]|nr:pyrophosphatase [Defluviitaleaceae bacterium]
PTCTARDISAAKELAQIAEVDMDDYGSKMFLAGTNLADYSPEEILAIDRKQFSVGTYLLYISQVNTLDIDAVLSKKDELIEAMDQFVAKTTCDLCLLMVTDLFRGGSELLIAGKAKELTIKAFDTPMDCEHIYLPDVVSRKGQVVPKLTMASQG